MYIHSVAAYIIDPTTENRAISGEIKKYLVAVPRPSNRFILLAVAGAAQCVHGKILPDNCGIYIATEYGNIESTYTCLDDVHIKRELPMPFSFANSLNNMTGFQLAKSLGLSGKNLVISSKGVSFEKALRMAAIDLQKNAQTSALVGGIDSAFPEFYATVPKGLPKGTVLKEGSAWLYLTNKKDNALGCIKDVRDFTDQATLIDWLKSYTPEKDTAMAWNSRIDTAERKKLLSIRPTMRAYDYVPTLGYYGTVSAAGMVDFLRTKPKGTLVHISKDHGGNYVVVEATTY